MAKHVLSLEMPDTLNECIMPVMDTSIYSDKSLVDCPYLDILAPGFSHAVRLDMDPGFCLINLTACDLELNEVLCALDLAICDPLPEVKEKLKELRLIEMLIKAAKAKVEFCHTPGQGMDLYEYAKKRLDKLACTVCI